MVEPKFEAHGIQPHIEANNLVNLFNAACVTMFFELVLEIGVHGSVYFFRPVCSVRLLQRQLDKIVYAFIQVNGQPVEVRNAAVMRLPLDLKSRAKREDNETEEIVQVTVYSISGITPHPLAGGICL